MNILQFLNEQPFFKTLSTGNAISQIQRGKILLNGAKISPMGPFPELKNGDLLQFKGYPNWEVEFQNEDRFFPEEKEVSNSNEHHSFRNGDIFQRFSVSMMDGTIKTVLLSAKRMWKDGFSHSDEFEEDVSPARNFVLDRQKEICAKLLSVDPKSIDFVESMDFAFSQGDSYRAYQLYDRQFVKWNLNH